jgi:hypothetical protein
MKNTRVCPILDLEIYAQVPFRTLDQRAIRPNRLRNNPICYTAELIDSEDNPERWQFSFIDS